MYLSPVRDPKHDQGRHRQRSVEIADITSQAEVAVDAVFDAMRTSMQQGDASNFAAPSVFSQAAQAASDLAENRQRVRILRDAPFVQAG
jgi:predicted RecA/RadA family phage recombinase